MKKDIAKWKILGQAATLAGLAIGLISQLAEKKVTKLEFEQKVDKKISEAVAKEIKKQLK